MNTCRSNCLSLGVILCAAAAGNAGAQNLLVNPSFESPGLAAGTFAAYNNNATLGSGWVVGATGGLVDIITASYGVGTWPGASDGNQFVFLGDGFAAASLHQDLALTTGQYNLSFDLAPMANGSYNRTADVSVSIVDTTTSTTVAHGEFTRPEFVGYAGQSLAFRAAAADTYRIVIANPGNYGDNIDNFSLTKTNVPDQTNTAALFAGATGLLLAAARRRRLPV